MEHTHTHTSDPLQCLRNCLYTGLGSASASAESVKTCDPKISLTYAGRSPVVGQSTCRLMRVPVATTAAALVCWLVIVRFSVPISIEEVGNAIKVNGSFAHSNQLRTFNVIRDQMLSPDAKSPRSVRKEFEQLY
jgi:hypothetical protein